MSPQKTESLLFDDGSGIGGPGQVVLNVQAQELEVGDPPQTLPTNEQGLNVHFSPPPEV